MLPFKNKAEPEAMDIFDDLVQDRWAASYMSLLTARRRFVATIMVYPEPNSDKHRIVVENVSHTRKMLDSRKKLFHICTATGLHSVASL